MMRVTNEMMYAAVLNQIQRNTNRLLTTQEVMASQKKINRVSDDPLSALRVFNLKHSVSKIDQYRRNLDRVNALQEAYDTTLDQAIDIVTRMKELTISQASNAAATPETRESVAIELISLRQNLLNIANYQLGDQYIYGGTLTSTPPFTDINLTTAPGANASDATLAASISNPVDVNIGDTYRIFFNNIGPPPTFNIINRTDPANPFFVSTNNVYTPGDDILFDGLRIRVEDGTGPAPPNAPQLFDSFNITVNPPGVYQGDSLETRIEIESNRQAIVNVTGDNVFQGIGTTGGENIFQLVDDTINALRADDIATIDAALDRYNSAIDQLGTKRALVGARQNIFEDTQIRHERIQIGFESLRANLENADITEAITEFNQAEMAYRASINAAAKVIQPTLLDFL